MSQYTNNTLGHVAYTPQAPPVYRLPVAVSFSLPQPHKSRGWKAKIRDRERTEPPHVTVLFKTDAWRLGLRERDYLDTRPDPGDVPDAVTEHLLSDDVFPQVVAAWDRLYPHNPVSSDAD